MAKVTAPNVGGQVRPKEPPGVKAKRIFKSFVKTNGYVVATTSLNYCGAIIADKLTEGAVSALFGKGNNGVLGGRFEYFLNNFLVFF